MSFQSELRRAALRWRHRKNWILKGAEMDTKKFIQTCWVIEAMALLLIVPIACAWMPVDRLEIFGKIVPALIGAVLGQGVAASAGPEVKRLIESRKVKIEKPGR